MWNIEYTNASGEKLSSPRIFAVVLDKMKCNDLVNPQIKTSESEMTQVKDGINVALQKVEFTPNETKALLSIKNINNNETDDVLFYGTSDSVILAGEKQSEMKFSSENPEMKSIIPAGKKKLVY